MKRIKLIFFIIVILVAFSMPVSAMTIVIDPGHGGGDTGAIGQGEVVEKDVNLNIGLYLRDYLNKYQDVNVIMTRSEDTGISVYDRAMVARNNKADLLISLHNNASATDETAHGVETYVTSNTCLPKYQENTLKLAIKITNNIASLGIYNRGAKISPQIKEENGDYYYEGASADYYGIIRYAMRGCKMDYGEITEGTYHDIRDGSGVPTVLVEHCFLKADNNFVDSYSDIQKLAEADGMAIVDFYNLQLKENSENNESISEDVITKPLTMYENVYQNYISNPIIPFELQNVDDRITGKDIKAAYPNSEIKLDGKDIQDLDQLRNGSIVDVDGKKYSIIIFGDTNNDGIVNILDAVTVLNHVKGRKILKEASLIAGDINYNGSLNILEAVKILNVVKGKIEYNQLID